jgi:hypothetical protein
MSLMHILAENDPEAGAVLLEEGMRILGTVPRTKVGLFPGVQHRVEPVWTGQTSRTRVWVTVTKVHPAFLEAVSRQEVGSRARVEEQTRVDRGFTAMVVREVEADPRVVAGEAALDAARIQVAQMEEEQEELIRSIREEREGLRSSYRYVASGREF